MKKLLGYLFLGLGLLIFWPVQIGLGLYGLYYIIMAFINSGVIAGLISIPIVGVGLSIIYFIIHLISAPFMVLVSSLLGRETRKITQEEINLQAIEAMKAEDERERTEFHEQMIKKNIAEGWTPSEAEEITKEIEETLYENSDKEGGKLPPT